MFRCALLGIVGLLLAVPANAQEWAKARLEKSLRHQEWAKVKHGSREVECFLVYPEVKDKATAVVVIHEIFGLSDWAKLLTDELAEAGYIAIAPDLLSGTGPKGGGSSEFSERGAVTRAVQSLPPDQVTADLNAVVEHVAKLPACNGKVVVGGFCWGGGQTFRFVTNNQKVKAGFVFYGTGPTSEGALQQIKCPVYGFYGGNDNRVNSTLGDTAELMKKAAKVFDPVVYAGAGHGFMRAGEAPDARPADKKARTEAWERWKKLLEGT
jgi:carboxymethylenebutenolidase